MVPSPVRAVLILFASLILPGPEALSVTFAEMGYRLLNGECPKETGVNSSGSSAVNPSSCRTDNVSFRQISKIDRQMEEVSENAYLVELAKERRAAMECSGQKLASLDQNPQEMNAFLEVYAEQLTALAKAKKRMSELSSAVATDAKVREEYKKAKAEANLYLSALPFSEIKSVRLMINHIVSQTDLFHGKGPEDWFKKQMKENIRSALKSGARDLQKDKTALDQGISSMGTSFENSLRESLAQDTDLIEAFRQKNKNKESNLRPVSCRVDAKYGKGAQYRDHAVMAVAVLGTAGAMAAPASVGLMSSITGAAASGAIPLRAGQIFRVMAMAGSSAATLSQIDKSCLSDSPNLSVSAAKAGSVCEPNALKSIEQESCYLAAGLAALGVATAPGLKAALGKLGKPTASSSIASAAPAKGADTGLSKTDEILKKNGLTREDLAAEKAAALKGAVHAKERSLVRRNAALNDQDRARQIAQDFPNLSKAQIDCVVNKVHSIGEGKGVYQYSKSEIVRKARVARKVCNVSVDDIDALIRLGYAGNVPTGQLADGTREISDFERLLGKAHRFEEQAVSAGKLSSAQLREQINQEKDLVKKAQLRLQLREAEQAEIAEALKDDPRVLDRLLQKDFVPIEASAAARDRKAITLSDEKARQLVSQGNSELETLMLEVKSGDLVGYKSFSHGQGFGQIKGVDPENPKNIMVEIRGPDQKMKVVSIPQTELAMTDKEKAGITAELMKAGSGKGELEKLLNKKPEVNVEKIAQDLAIQASKSPQNVKAEQLEERMLMLEQKYSNSPLKLQMDPEYEKLRKEYRQITSMSPEDRMILRAVREIDPDDLNSSKQAREILEKAEKIQFKHTSDRLNPEDREILRSDLAQLKKQVEAAPERVMARDLMELKQINQSESFGRLPSIPSRQEIIKSTGIESINPTQYQSMEKLFKEHPRQLSDESQEWINRQGRFLLQDMNKKQITDPKALAVKRRLEL